MDIIRIIEENACLHKYVKVGENLTEKKWFLLGCLKE